MIGNAKGAITSILPAVPNAIDAQIGNRGIAARIAVVAVVAEKVIAAVEDSVTAEVETVEVETAEVETAEVETAEVAAISAATRVDRK